ncbi:MAG: RHS repeat-associated core domain-containing protein [Phycisphaerales bacterium JB043]
MALSAMRLNGQRGIWITALAVFFLPAASASASCFADLDGDGDVDGADLGLLLGAWGTSGPADLNNSGSVNGSDLGLLLGAWGPCPLSILEPPPMHLPPAAPISADEIPSYVDDRYVSLGMNGHEVGVYDFSGETVVHAVDLRVAGRGLDFVLTRKYRSRQQTESTLGSSSHWSHSYELQLQQLGGDILVHDGNTRQDTYTFDPGSGVWVREGHFRVLEQDVSGEYVMTFANRGTWRFHGFIGAPEDGKIKEIADRYGNTLRFFYDGLGRLQTVQDTLHHAGNPREYLFVYDPNGFLQSVTDFAGRQVQYEYYDGIMPGGEFGDLRQVTSVQVVGTSTGNDFPAGKTTTYEWTFGNPDPALNHNLHRITDGKGQTYAEFQYKATVTPTDVDYDRVERYVLGATGWTDRVYVSQNPGDEHPDSVLKVIANDRAGNVTERLYDLSNRLVELRQFTGRAPNPSALTDETTNRPTGQVRASDPPVYITNYEYNTVHLQSNLILARGNSRAQLWDISNPNPRARANLLSRVHSPGGITSDQASIAESWVYDNLLNGDTNQVTLHTDPKGNPTSYTYDPSGNVIHIDHRIPGIVEDFTYNPFGQMLTHELPENDNPGVRRLDQFTYYGLGDGFMNGYQRESIIDLPGFALTTTYEYDPLGRVTRTIDPRGNDTLIEFNQLDQVVRVDSRAVSLTLGPTRYATLSYYDANDNLVRVDRSNIDKDGNTDPNDLLTTIYVYDILDNRVRAVDEVGVFGVPTAPLQLDDAGLPDSEFVRVEYDYDPNENVRDIRFGEASEGRQPDNIVRYIYDERDLVFEEIRAPGSSSQSTTQFDYDENANLVTRSQGLEDVVNGPYESTYGYDGYDRLLEDRFAMGSNWALHYDANSNIVSRELQGETLDVPGDIGNVALSKTTYQYDNMDRIVLRTTDHFDLITQAPIGDGARTTQYIWTPASRLIQEIDDNLHLTLHGCDTTYRYSLFTDAKGNTLTRTYDSNSNVIKVESTEKADSLAPDQSFEKLYDYDALDRLIRIIDGVGNTTEHGYDSRSNLVRSLDADLNETTYAYDSMDRRVLESRTLTDTGTGAGVVIGSIDITQAWDDTHRVTSRTDGEGNTTTYEYDELNRIVRREHADTTFYLYDYDVHDNMVQQVDPSSTVIDYTYDLNGRRTDLAVVAGPGIATDTTFVQFQYDGKDRLVSAVDDDANSIFGYDSLGNLTFESTNGKPVTNVFDGESNNLLTVYPSGFEVHRVFNPINLISSISAQDGIGVQPIIDYLYVGDRRESGLLGNGTSVDFAYNGITGVPNDPADFGFRQISDITVTGVGPLLDLDLDFDARQNKDNSELFLFTDASPREDRSIEYDSVSRLLVTNNIRFNVLYSACTYDLDLAGNRILEFGTESTGSFFLDSLIPPADDQMNQYTITPRTNEVHNDRGDRIEVLPLTVTPPSPWLNVWTFDNKLHEHVNPFTGVTTTHTYDAIGRRVSTTVDDGITATTTDFVFNGDEIIEEFEGPIVLRSQVMDPGCDDKTLSVAIAGLVTSVLFMHHDDQNSVRLVTDLLGSPVEEWEYSDFGEPRRPLFIQEPDLFGAAASDTAALSGSNPQKYAENFQVPQNARVTTLRWGGGYAFSTPALIPPDDFTIRFYDDNAGSPGVLLHEENVGEVGRVATGNVMTVNSVDEYMYLSRIELPPSLLAGNVYWISIENNLLGTGNVWGWETTSSGDGVAAVSVLNGPYGPSGLDFSLFVYTDQSSVEIPYLFHGKRYDHSTRLYYNRARDLDPQTGRFTSRDPIGAFGDPYALGNAYTYAGNNPYTLIDSSGFMPGPTPGRGNSGMYPFTNPANTPTAPTWGPSKPPTPPTMDDGPRMPPGQPIRQKTQEERELEELMKYTLDVLSRNRSTGSYGYGSICGGGAGWCYPYSGYGYNPGGASKGNTSDASADDDFPALPPLDAGASSTEEEVNLQQGAGSADERGLPGGDHPVAVDPTEYEVTIDLDDDITTRERLYFDPSRWAPHITPYGADGKPYVPRLQHLPHSFGRLPDDRYRLYLVEEGGDRLVLDFLLKGPGYCEDGPYHPDVEAWDFRSKRNLHYRSGR